MFAVDEPRWRNEVNAVTQQEVKNPLECSNILHQNMIHRLREPSKLSGIYS